MTSTRAATAAVASTRRDVLHVHGRNPAATIVGDLIHAPQIADGIFDCIVLTQTLHLIYDVGRAVATLHRILRPGGVVLATVARHQPALPRRVEPTPGRGRSARGSRAGSSPPVSASATSTVEAHGNSLAAAAFLHGLATAELRARPSSTAASRAVSCS